MTRTEHLLISCEHGGNRIPARYRELFAGLDDVLQTHRGFDPGALVLAREMAKTLGAPLYFSTVSRMLIDLNRSVGHPFLYSEATRGAPREVRDAIRERVYLPHRNRIRAEIDEAIARGDRVIHIASHSFTPVFDGEIRNADIGLLYDPARPGEVDLCQRWQAQLKALAPEMKVRRNDPYAGASDGLATHLRHSFPDEVYIGVELEMNQKHALQGGRPWRTLRGRVIEALRRSLGFAHNP